MRRHTSFRTMHDCPLIPGTTCHARVRLGQLGQLCVTSLAHRRRDLRSVRQAHSVTFVTTRLSVTSGFLQSSAWCYCASSAKIGTLVSGPSPCRFRLKDGFRLVHASGTSRQSDKIAPCTDQFSTYISVHSNTDGDCPTISLFFNCSHFLQRNPRKKDWAPLYGKLMPN